MSSAGREQMIKELKDAQAIFVQAEERLSQATKAVREKYGITDAKIEEFLAAHLGRIQNDL